MTGPKWYDLELSGLGGGKLEERFQDALQAVAANIDDPQMKRKTSREVVVKLKLTPLDEERRECRAEIEVSTKLAAQHGFGVPAYVVRGAGGHFSVQTADLRQKALEMDPPVGGGADGADAVDGEEN